MTLLVATGNHVFRVDPDSGAMTRSEFPDLVLPTCLAVDPHTAGRAWCGSDRHGVYRSDDGGRSWRPAGLADRRIMSLTASPVEEDVVWAGTEPSEIWRSGDGGESWEPTAPLEGLPSSPGWAFPPRPETHHARWIACHPQEPGRLWVAIEAGALVSTTDGGRSWRDRVPDGPYDTHELAVHPNRPDTLRVSAGDGYYESHDGGESWSRPREGLDVGYLRSVAIDPGDPAVVVVSAASGPRSTYVAGRADGRLYRRSGNGSWRRVTEGWPDPPRTIAPLLVAGRGDGALWAADERGVHRSDDGGSSWRRVSAFQEPPRNLRGLVCLIAEQR